VAGERLLLLLLKAVCDSRVLLLRQSVTVVHCCYSSLRQSFIVVTAVCDSRVLLLRQSVTVAYCCFTAVCDSRVFLLLQQSVTVVYCCCYGSL